MSSKKFETNPPAQVANGFAPEGESGNWDRHRSWKARTFSAYSEFGSMTPRSSARASSQLTGGGIAPNAFNASKMNVFEIGLSPKAASSSFLMGSANSGAF